jgi:hypothetical protein
MRDDGIARGLDEDRENGRVRMRSFAQLQACRRKAGGLCEGQRTRRDDSMGRDGTAGRAWGNPSQARQATKHWRPYRADRSNRRMQAPTKCASAHERGLAPLIVPLPRPPPSVRSPAERSSGESARQTTGSAARRRIIVQSDAVADRALGSLTSARSEDGLIVNRQARPVRPYVSDGSCDHPDLRVIEFRGEAGDRFRQSRVGILRPVVEPELRGGEARRGE